MRARRDRRYPPERRLPRRRDGSRIKDVLPEVHSAIDPGANEVRPPRKKTRSRMERDVDAIGRRAVDGVDSRLDEARTERSMKAQRVARCALLVFGRDD